MSSAGVGNVNDNVDNNIVFTIKDTKLYFSVVNLLARDNKNYQNLFCKGLKKSVCWNEYNAKGESENMKNEFS